MLQERQLHRIMVGTLVVLLVVALLGAARWLSGSHVAELATLGYPGIFLVMLLSSGSVLLPVPGLSAVVAAGALWNPALVGVAAALGGATGELTGYAAGKAGAVLLNGHRHPTWASLERHLARYGFWLIAVLALVPNPVFDTAGLLAGSLNYPLRRFWLACFLGNVGKCLAAAYLGEAVLRWWG
ncbi:MAG: VTT domain-containing protein [Chloroflexi bacterium]|nr:VTT domain-containing protein [Chloroflexota bacterium]